MLACDLSLQVTAHVTCNNYVTKARPIRTFSQYFETETEKKKRKELSLSP